MAGIFFSKILQYFHKLCVSLFAFIEYNDIKVAEKAWKERLNGTHYHRRKQSESDA